MTRDAEPVAETQVHVDQFEVALREPHPARAVDRLVHVGNAELAEGVAREPRELGSVHKARSVALTGVSIVTP